MKQPIRIIPRISFSGEAFLNCRRPPLIYWLSRYELAISRIPETSQVVSHISRDFSSCDRADRQPGSRQEARLSNKYKLEKVREICPEPVYLVTGLLLRLPGPAAKFVCSNPILLPASAAGRGLDDHLKENCSYCFLEQFPIKYCIIQNLKKI